MTGDAAGAGFDGFDADVTLSYDTELQARVIADALAVEARAPLPKARVTVTRDGGDVVLAVRARDPVALRAALNSYLRWARVAEDAHRVTGGRG